MRPGVQANTVPATFWTLAYLLQPEHAHHMEDVQRLITGNGADQGPPPGEPAGRHTPLWVLGGLLPPIGSQIIRLLLGRLCAM